MNSGGATSFSTSLCKIPDRNKLWAFPAQEFPAPGTAESASAAQIFAAAV